MKKSQLRQIIREEIQKINEEFSCDYSLIKKISKQLATKMHCDSFGSCVHFAELFVELINKTNPKLLDCFRVIEGYVDTPIGDGIPQQHTWIELLNGEIIDPTFIQFTKYGDATYLKNRKKAYTGKEYFEDTPDSWFSDRRKKYPERIWKKIISEESEKLVEIRQPLINYLKQRLPNTPEYVIKDMVYPATKDLNREEMDGWIKEIEGFKWKLHKNFPIKKQNFTDENIQQLNRRLKGENPNQVSRDDERHKIQREKILKQGIPQEPIILTFENNKYSLWEGWHRVIQLFQLYPKGYLYPNVYVGTK